MTRERPVHTLGILLFDDAEELDYVGPWEVFTTAAMLRDDLAVVTIAEHDRPVRSAKGLRVLPDHTFETAPDLDVILVPGGQGTRAEVENPVLIDWLAKVSERCVWVTSVCTGSLLLHEAGPARGRNVTTHWGFVDTLRERAPDATVRDDVRYLRDGNVVTAAGVSAGIDMALWLVGEIWGVEAGRTTQRIIQYDPEPPYSSDA